MPLAAKYYDPITNKMLSTFVANSITPVTCNLEYSRAAESGTLIAFDISAKTTPELAAQNFFPKFEISGHDFKFIAESGTTFSGNLDTLPAFSCLPVTEMFPIIGMGPAEKVKGKVILDVPAANGILVFEPFGHDVGWEYTLNPAGYLAVNPPLIERFQEPKNSSGQEFHSPVVEPVPCSGPFLGWEHGDGDRRKPCGVREAVQQPTVISQRRRGCRAGTAWWNIEMSGLERESRGTDLLIHLFLSLRH